ncbi:MAG: hypothetical protein COB36_02680 [Alphaproteobacteria bacterium]|nr:MAG: hypothetical protein COB36_02680 [Alphaproteobacteria bacterium]
MTDTKNIPSPYDWKTLADDMKSNGDITQNFFENAQSVHALIAQEAAHNLHYYFEYAKIFVNNEHDALDLVQHAFEKSLEKPQL